jgi:hypothetical protein
MKIPMLGSHLIVLRNLHLLFFNILKSKNTMFYNFPKENSWNQLFIKGHLTKFNFFGEL